MVFTEPLKRSLRARAHFACCLCFAKGIEIHHIVPRAEGGPDTEENAAPLCPSCHETYGDNPKKRKLLREARDAWFEICDRRFVSAPHGSPLSLEEALSAPTKGTGKRWGSVDHAASHLLAYPFTEVGRPRTSWSSVESLLSIATRPQFWPDADWRRWRRAMLSTFGRRLAGRLLLQVLLEQRISLGRGMSARQFGSVVAQFRVMAMVFVAATLEPEQGLRFTFTPDRHLKVRLAPGNAAAG